MINFGNVDAGLTLYIPFNTFDSNGASVTITGLSVTDIEIYKNGSVTQRASDAGFALLDTDGIDFDGITGIHGFSIDLSDNTDSGFYSAGAFYWVVVSAITADTRTVNFVAATFRIGPAAANATQFAGQTITAAAGVTLPSEVASPTNITAGTITTVTNLTNAPTAGDFTATMKASITTAVPTVAGISDGVWDELISVSSHNISSSAGATLRLANSLSTVEGAVNDASATASGFVTNLTSTVDDFYKDALLVFTEPGLGLIGQSRPISTYNGTTKAVTFDEPFTSAPANGEDFSIISTHIHPVSQIQAGLATAATLATVLADTNELQTDWADGGRLDLILDARASQTSVDTIDGIVDDILTDTGTTLPATLSSMAGATFDTSTDSLEAIRNRGDVAWITATGFSTHSAADVVTAIGTGSSLTALATQASVNTIDDLLDTEISAIKTVTDKVDTALVLDGAVYQFTANALELAPTGGSAPTAADIADAVWDEVLSGHLTAGTTGAGLNAAGSAGDPWATALPGAYGAGTAGKIIGDNVDALISSRMATFTQPTGFLAATFPATVASPTNITGGTVTTVTNLTNLPAIPANWLTAAGIAADVTTELQNGLATAADQALIKAKTDQFVFTVANQVDANVISGGLDATGIRSAVGLASANLDTQLADLPTNAELATADDAVLAQVALVKAKTDLIPASPAAVSDIPSANAIAAATLDLADGIETGLTLRQAQRLQVAAAAGELAGAETTEVTIRNAVADTKTRITATVDANGNRTAIITDLT